MELGRKEHLVLGNFIPESDSSVKLEKAITSPDASGLLKWDISSDAGTTSRLFGRRGGIPMVCAVDNDDIDDLAVLKSRVLSFESSESGALGSISLRTLGSISFVQCLNDGTSLSDKLYVLHSRAPGSTSSAKLFLSVFDLKTGGLERTVDALSRRAAGIAFADVNADGADDLCYYTKRGQISCPLLDGSVVNITAPRLRDLTTGTVQLSDNSFAQRFLILSSDRKVLGIGRDGALDLLLPNLSPAASNGTVRRRGKIGSFGRCR